MKLDITRILSGETDRLDFDVSFPASENDGFSYFTEWGVDFTSEIRALCTVKNNGGYISLVSDITVMYKTLCARCLKGLENSFSHSFEKGVAAELADEENDDFILSEGGMVDIQSAVCEEFLLSFPLKELCCADCKGLCPKCGKNLNEGGCSCRSEGDPRMASLKALLSDYE